MAIKINGMSEAELEQAIDHRETKPEVLFTKLAKVMMIHFLKIKQSVIYNRVCRG